MPPLQRRQLVPTALADSASFQQSAEPHPPEPFIPAPAYTAAPFDPLPASNPSQALFDTWQYPDFCISAEAHWAWYSNRFELDNPRFLRLQSTYKERRYWDHQLDDCENNLLYARKRLEELFMAAEQDAMDHDGGGYEGEGGRGRERLLPLTPEAEAAKAKAALEATELAATQARQATLAAKREKLHSRELSLREKKEALDRAEHDPEAPIPDSDPEEQDREEEREHVDGLTEDEVSEEISDDEPLPIYKPLPSPSGAARSIGPSPQAHLSAHYLETERVRVRNFNRAFRRSQREKFALEDQVRLLSDKAAARNPKAQQHLPGQTFSRGRAPSPKSDSGAAPPAAGRNDGASGSRPPAEDPDVGQAIARAVMAGEWEVANSLAQASPAYLAAHNPASQKRPAPFQQQQVSSDRLTYPPSFLHTGTPAGPSGLSASQLYLPAEMCTPKMSQHRVLFSESPAEHSPFPLHGHPAAFVPPILHFPSQNGHRANPLQGHPNAHFPVHNPSQNGHVANPLKGSVKSSLLARVFPELSLWDGASTNARLFLSEVHSRISSAGGDPVELFPGFLDDTFKHRWKIVQRRYSRPLIWSELYNEFLLLSGEIEWQPELEARETFYSKTLRMTSSLKKYVSDFYGLLTEMMIDVDPHLQCVHFLSGLPSKLQEACAFDPLTRKPFTDLKALMAFAFTCQAHQLKTSPSSTLLLTQTPVAAPTPVTAQTITDTRSNKRPYPYAKPQGQSSKKKPWKPSSNKKQYQKKGGGPSKPSTPQGPPPSTRTHRLPPDPTGFNWKGYTDAEYAYRTPAATVSIGGVRYWVVDPSSGVWKNHARHLGLCIMCGNAPHAVNHCL